MLSTIQLKARMVSLEAITPEQTLQASVERLPDFINDVRTFITNLFSTEDFDGNYGADAALLRKITALKMTDLMSHSVNVPPGLKVSFKELLDILNQFAQGEMQLIVRNVLTPYNTWLGVVLTNPELLASFKNDRSIEKLQLTDVSQYKHSIDKCFNAVAGNATLPFPKAYRNLGEYRSVNENIDQLVTSVKKINIQEISNLVAEIDKRLASLIELIMTPNNDYRISGTVIKTLANISYLIASECEFFSVYRYHVQALAQAIKDSNAQLNATIS